MEITAQEKSKWFSWKPTEVEGQTWDQTCVCPNPAPVTFVTLPTTLTLCSMGMLIFIGSLCIFKIFESESRLILK